MMHGQKNVKIYKLTFFDHMRVCDIYYNVEWFHLHNFAVCCIVSTLVKLPVTMIAKAIETFW
jgi:hypothetical protein